MAEGYRAKAFLSADWYRVADLTPRLRGHVEIHRQRFRGDTWYIVQDHESGKYHRITPAANYIVSMMNGRRTVQDLWEMACERFAGEPPTQSETIRLLSQLHAADLIASEMPNIEEIGSRHARQVRQTMMSRIRNPLALRMPILDPDRFLDATVWLVRPLFSWFGFALWLALVVAGVSLAILNWPALTDNVADRVLAAENILLLILAFPVLKAVHELGHAYATKVWGGEVHEIGIMLLVLMPVPYVDASASAAFQSKWQRAVVSGAGIMVELAIASLALLFWLNAEQGVATAFAFNLMLIGGVSTLLFNGNPLLRFDGYYVFADLIEIPNLGQRSNKYFWYVIQRYLLRVPEAENPVRAKGEAKWLFTYAVAAFLYRVFIAFVIALFIATRFFFVGVILALWALSNTFLMPLWKGMKFLFASPKLRGRRRWAVGLAAGAVAALGGFLFALPLPYATSAYGVVWLDQEEILRAETDGFMESVSVTGEGPVATMSDPDLDGRVRVNEARLRETSLRLSAVLVVDRVQAGIFREQLSLIEGQLEDSRRRQSDLTLARPEAGRLIVPSADDLEGRHVTQGTVLGYVTGRTPMRIRVAVDQAQVDLVRNRTEAVDLLFMRAPDRPVAGRIIGEVPQSRNAVPSLALTTEGGGTFTRNPTETDALATLERVFLFDISPEDGRPVEYVGERALVRFDHGSEPLGLRLWRGARQLFLRHFNV